MWRPCGETRDAHLVLGPAEGDLQPFHSLNHGLHGHEDVLVDQGPEALAVLLRVARPVDDAHLLDERALPALTGAWGDDSAFSSALRGSRHPPPPATRVQIPAL